MNLTLPEKEKFSKKTITFYIIIVCVCLLAIVVVIGVKILGNDVINSLFGINKLVKRTEQEEVTLKANFEQIFNNQVKDSENYTTQKMDSEKQIVYTYYQKEDKNEEHDLNINLPYINIKNKVVQNFNKEIVDTFESKSEQILNSTGENIAYTVKYYASIENNILSLIIYSDLKQEISAQRVLIQTFNFNLDENKEVSLKDIIKIYDLNNNQVQNKIDQDIKEAKRKSDDLKDLGYNVFSRDIESNMYNIENINEFLIYNNNIYIIFAYGNDRITSERDVVII